MDAELRPRCGAGARDAQAVTALLTSLAFNAAGRSRIYLDLARTESNCVATTVPKSTKELRENGMAQAANMTDDRTGAAIDRGHLTRMTFGDRGLEREVLELFDRQSAMLIARMREGQPAAIASLAHTLKGSAAGIGAGRVARSADAAEMAANASPSDCSQAIDRLAQAVDEARALIAELLKEH